MCGHNSDRDPYPETPAIIYVPSKFLPKANRSEEYEGYSEIERFIRFANGENVTPRSASCLSKGVKDHVDSHGRYSLIPRFIAIGNEDDDEYGDVTDFQNQNRADRKNTMRDLAIADLAENSYVDEKEQAEVLKNLNENADCIEVLDYNAISYDYVRSDEDGISTSIASNERWNDRWNPGKFFKFYWTEGGFYFAGYTQKPSDKTKDICHNAILPSTTKEIWHPSADLIRNDTRRIIRSVEDVAVLPEMTNQPGNHTFFIHKTLVNHPDIRVMRDRAAVGKGGKNWPRGEEGRDEFIRMVIVNVSVMVAVPEDINVNITVNVVVA
jgi:hypothetical protein